jgi:hypothetical protein
MKNSKNLLTLFLIVIISIACSSNQSETPTESQTDSLDMPLEKNATAKELPFDIKIAVEKLKADTYNLSVTMFLDEGAYFGSPFSNNSFGGLFKIEIDPDNRLIVDETLIETPASVETHDPYSNGPVNWVIEETNYKQKLAIQSDQDFKVSGVVSAVIEPICSRYEIAFELKWKKGTLSVSQSAPIVANL